MDLQISNIWTNYLTFGMSNLRVHHGFHFEKTWLNWSEQRPCIVQEEIHLTNAEFFCHPVSRNFHLDQLRKYLKKKNFLLFPPPWFMITKIPSVLQPLPSNPLRWHVLLCPRSPFDRRKTSNKRLHFKFSKSLEKDSLLGAWVVGIERDCPVSDFRF